MPGAPDLHPATPVDEPGNQVDAPAYAEPGSPVVDEPGEVSSTEPVTDDGPFATTTFGTQTSGT